MNAKELAKAIGVHHNTIYNMIKTGELKAYKKSKTYEVDEEQAQKLIHAKNIIRAEESIPSGTDEVIKLLKEKQRQTFLKVIDQIYKLHNTIEDTMKDNDINDLSIHNKLLELSKSNSYRNLVHFIDTFEKHNDMIYDIEFMKQDYEYEDYQSNTIKRMKAKYEELDNNLVKYTVEDAHVIAGNSLTFL